MSTAGGVDVVVAAVEAVVLRVDPALELDGDLRRRPFRGIADLLRDHAIFRAAAIDHRQLAGRQKHDAAAVPINLILEEEIGSEPFRLGGIDAARLVLERESARGRRAVEIDDLQLDRDGRLDVEQHRRLGAEAEVLRPLPDVEDDGRLALARLARCEIRARAYSTFRPLSFSVIGWAVNISTSRKRFLISAILDLPRLASRVDGKRLRAADLERAW